MKINKLMIGLGLILLGVIGVALGADPGQTVNQLETGIQNGTFPDLFKPAPNDLSIWYLGNIFGSDLMSGLVDSTWTLQLSGIRLMSILFGVFNQVALTVGIIIIVYTVLAGTLNTAHEGKPLGEKWNGVWMPVRISAGIALLVPKGGSGYCLAQSLVMWLTLQGIGAADTVWNSMVDYFAQGGAIYSSYADQSGHYMTKENVLYGLGLEGYSEGKAQINLLKSMVCMEAHNTSKDKLPGENNYVAYTMNQDSANVYFGDQKAMLALANASSAKPPYIPTSTVGMECGAVTVTAPECPMACGSGDANCTPGANKGSKCGSPEQREQIYTLANWNLAGSLQGLAKELVKNPNNTGDTWAQYNTAVFRGVDLYVNYLVGYMDFLHYKTDFKASDTFDLYKKYGWILAGNYYTILSGFKEHVDQMTRLMYPPATNTWKVVNGAEVKPKDYDAVGDPLEIAYRAEMNFWNNGFDSNEANWHTYIPSYEKPSGSGSMAANPSKSKSFIGAVNMSEILGKLGSGNAVANAGISAGRAVSGHKIKGSSTAVTTKAVQTFIEHLTGTDSGSGDFRVAKDPILKISTFGKKMTQSAMALFGIAAALIVLSEAGKWCTAQTSVGFMLQATGNIVAYPMLALGGFMYAQGAILGVFIPLIPYLTFFIGAVGWMLQVVEAVAAAPIVAIGLVFPETRDDVWGKAAPAYMLILALFLRPPLMLVGFAAAMIVLWVLTELLNIGFLTLTTVTFKIEDAFGFVTIMTAYTAVFTIVVTRSYELINVVPNKVLNWIGGSGYEVTGAGEAISAAKGGVQEGAGAVASGAQSTAKDTGKALAEKAKKVKEKNEASLTPKK